MVCVTYVLVAYGTLLRYTIKMANDSLQGWQISMQNTQAAARSFLFLTRQLPGRGR